LITGTSILYLFAVAVVGQALTPSSFLTTVDRERLRAVFEGAQPYPDAATAHYSILGLKLLGATIPKEQVSLLVSLKLFHTTNNQYSNKHLLIVCFFRLTDLTD